jgi:hypothetical protein
MQAGGGFRNRKKNMPEKKQWAGGRDQKKRAPRNAVNDTTLPGTRKKQTTGPFHPKLRACSGVIIAP